MTKQALDLKAKPKSATLEAWQALARRALGGTTDGVLGTRADWPSADASGVPGAAPYTRGTNAARMRWDIRTVISESDPGRANAQALEDIEGGATSLWIDIAAFGGRSDALPAALNSLPLDRIAIALDRADANAARSALRLVDKPDLFLGIDDFAAAARGISGSPADSAALAREVSSLPGVRPISIDTRPYHNAGATPALELGAALASGVAYLRVLTEAGIPIEAAVRQIAFILVTDTDVVRSTAKLRAFRRTWARVLNACDAGDAMRDVHVTSISSELTMTKHDVYTNILRTTLASFAGAIGGADAIALLPLDVRQGATSDDARRIARNTQSILLEEANIARAIDPGGGAFAIERTSEELAQASWREFQDIERLGGVAVVLSSGFLANRISQEWQNRRSRIAARKEWITGISDFPQLSEIAAAPATGALRFAPTGPRTGPLQRHHLDEEFEALRAASDEYLAGHGERPKIYLVSIGTEIDAGTRVAFARSLFESGGIETVAGAPTLDAESAAAAFLDSGIALAALCSSDALYAEKSLGFAHEIARAGARGIYMIGAPGDLEASLRAAGVDEFVDEDVDAIALLTRAYETLGVGS